MSAAAEIAGFWDVRLLGPVVLLRNAIPVPSTSSLLRTLTALLAMTPGAPVSTDVIIDELWGGDLPRDPKAAVHALVSRLRKWVREAGGDQHALRFRSEGYVLEVTPDRIDLHRFLLAARAILEDPDASSQTMLARCDRARDEWFGEPFGGCAPGPRLVGERFRLNELGLALAERRCTTLIALGHYQPAIADLRVLLVENPAREELVASAMVALYRAGRQREALQLFQDTRRQLVEVFGLSPGPALSGLEQRILQHDPTLAAPGPAHRPKGRSVVRPVIVGREEELAFIARERALGLGRILVVTGEAGCGKTTLVQAAVSDASAEGARVGLASFDRGDSPLTAWRDALRQLDVDSPVVGSAHEGVAFNEVRTVLASAAATMPIVLGIEDLHRADSASLGLVLALGRAGVPPRVTLLVSAREPDVDPGADWLASLADLARLPDVGLLQLRALSADAVRNLVALRLSHLEADSVDRLGLLLHERSGGHALHLSALLDVMRSLPDETTCRQAAARVPHRLLPLISYYVGSLSVSSREAIEALAVLGRAPVGLVAEALETTVTRALRALRPALELGLVADEGGVFRLRHALTEQVVVEGTPAATGHHLHAQVLRRLDWSRTDPFEILRHAVGSGPLIEQDRLGQAQLVAARNAYARGAFEEALALASDAAVSVRAHDKPETQIYVGLALAALGRTGEADSVLDQVLEAGSLSLELAVLAAVGHEPLGVRATGDERRLARLQRVFSSTSRAPATPRLDLLRALAIEESLVHGEVRSTEARTEMAELATKLDSDGDQARLAQLDARELVEAPVGAEARLAAAERAYDLAMRANDVLLRLNSMEFLASAALAAAELERCQDVLWELSRTAEQSGRPRSRWVARILRAALLLAAGEAEADAMAQEAMGFGSSSGISDAMGAYGVHLLAQRLMAGDLVPVLPLVSMAIAAYPKLPAWRAAGSLAHAHAGDVDTAREQLALYLSLRRKVLSRHFDRPGLCLAAHAALALADADAAEEVLASLPPTRGMIVVGMGAAVLGPVNLSVGLAELASGRPERSVVRLAEAAALADELGWRPWSTVCNRWLELVAGGPAGLDADGTTPA